MWMLMENKTWEIVSVYKSPNIITIEVQDLLLSTQAMDMTLVDPQCGSNFWTVYGIGANPPLRGIWVATDL
jgi:hypothetical protein